VARPFAAGHVFSGLFFWPDFPFHSHGSLDLFFLSYLTRSRNPNRRLGFCPVRVMSLFRTVGAGGLRTTEKAMEKGMKGVLVGRGGLKG
jgi:hypothetical protein